MPKLKRKRMYKTAVFGRISFKRRFSCFDSLFLSKNWNGSVFGHGKERCLYGGVFYIAPDILNLLPGNLKYVSAAGVLFGNMPLRSFSCRTEAGGKEYIIKCVWSIKKPPILAGKVAVVIIMPPILAVKIAVAIKTPPIFCGKNYVSVFTWRSHKIFVSELYRKAHPFDLEKQIRLIFGGHL